MTKTLLPLCAALLLLSPATSFAAPAQTDGGGSYVNDEGARVTQNGDVREVVIEDGEAIDGDSLKPGGENLYGARSLVHRSMISLRADFRTQLIRLSADI
jgi:hypothetical protein